FGNGADVTVSISGNVVDLNILEVQGVYIANGKLISSNLTSSFTGRGIFVGWGGVELNREMPDQTNRYFPAERFVYRPDFMINLPEQMMYSQTIWQETN